MSRTRRSIEAGDLEAAHGRLQALDGPALRAEWRRLYGTEPPRLGVAQMRGAVAYRIQERALGGLSPALRRRLREALDKGKTATRPTAPSLKPGTRLVREWNGRMHEVMVITDGFVWQGRRHGSLSEIAREITGARWSGPRFFGLIRKSAHEPG